MSSNLVKTVRFGFIILGLICVFQCVSEYFGLSNKVTQSIKETETSGGLVVMEGE